MARIHDNLQFALDNYGPVEKIRNADAAETSRLREFIPAPIPEFINEVGYCSFHGGLFKMCNPDTMRSVLALVFGADSQFDHRHCHVIGFTAFGQLHVWSNTYRSFFVDLYESFVFCRALTLPKWAPTATLEQSISNMIPDSDDADFLDFQGIPMFSRCVEKLGPLDADECYGFVPALAVVGIDSPLRRIENVRRVKLMEHFAIIAQMQTFHLMKLVPEGVERVRPIG